MLALPPTVMMPLAVALLQKLIKLHAPPMRGLRLLLPLFVGGVLLGDLFLVRAFISHGAGVPIGFRATRPLKK
jgi:hypothetical protein